MPEKSDFVPEADPEFLAEYIRGSFVADVFSAMEEQGVNKSQLAERLGKSRQYVGRVLNETANFTIDSIAQISAALEMDVVLRLKKSTEVAVIKPYSDWLLEQQWIQLDLSLSYMDEWPSSSITTVATEGFSVEWKNPIGEILSFRTATDKPYKFVQPVAEQAEMAS